MKYNIITRDQVPQSFLTNDRTKHYHLGMIFNWLGMEDCIILEAYPFLTPHDRPPYTTITNRYLIGTPNGQRWGYVNIMGYMDKGTPIEINPKNHNHG